MILEHNDAGALGVIVNRPLDEELGDELGEWRSFLTPPSTVFDGGPVEPMALIGIARRDVGWESVDLSVGPQFTVERLRVFRGYSGWGAGQLDNEIEQGAWMVFAANDEDLFTTVPGGMWRSVLRRQGGRTAWVADAPDDLSMN